MVLCLPSTKNIRNMFLSSEVVFSCDYGKGHSTVTSLASRRSSHTRGTRGSPKHNRHLKRLPSTRTQSHPPSPWPPLPLLPPAASSPAPPAPTLLVRLPPRRRPRRRPLRLARTHSLRRSVRVKTTSTWRSSSSPPPQRSSSESESHSLPFISVTVRTDSITACRPTAQTTCSARWSSASSRSTAE